jgi:hypothetical protein
VNVSYYYMNPAAPQQTCEEFTQATVTALQQLFTNAGVRLIGPTTYAVGELNNNLRVLEPLKPGESSDDSSTPQSPSGKMGYLLLRLGASQQKHGKEKQ